MRDIECALIERWHWSLYDLDQAEMESVLGFIGHYPRWQERQSDAAGKPRAPRKADANALNWL